MGEVLIKDSEFHLEIESGRAKQPESLSLKLMADVPQDDFKKPSEIGAKFSKLSLHHFGECECINSLLSFFFLWLAF